MESQFTNQCGFRSGSAGCIFTQKHRAYPLYIGELLRNYIYLCRRNFWNALYIWVFAIQIWTSLWKYPSYHSYSGFLQFTSCGVSARICKALFRWNFIYGSVLPNKKYISYLPVLLGSGCLLGCIGRLTSWGTNYKHKFFLDCYMFTNSDDYIFFIFLSNLSE